MINLSLAQYNLLSSLPSQFSVSEVSDRVKVAILLDGIVGYETTLYAYEGWTTFYGFQDFVRQSMRARQMVLAALTIVATHDDRQESISGKYVVFNEVVNIDIEQDLLYRRFLTIRSYYRLPRTGVMQLVFFSDSVSPLSLIAECVCKEDDGSIRTVPFTRRIPFIQIPYIYYVNLDITEIQQSLEQEHGTDVGKLLAMTCHVEERSMTVFISDEPYEVDFFFCNSFNIWERIYIYGTTKIKTAFDRKEAVSKGVSSFYDMSSERKYEVETAPMMIEEAEWFNEFLASPRVERELNEDWRPTVLISDINSEISDNAKDLIKMKFSWRYDDNTRYIGTSIQPQVFSPPYNTTFK